MPIDASRRAAELELLAVRLEELATEASRVAGLEAVRFHILAVRRRVLRIAQLLRIFARTGPDNYLDPPSSGV